VVVSRKELHKPTVSQLTRLLAQVLFFIIFGLDPLLQTGSAIMGKKPLQ